MRITNASRYATKPQSTSKTSRNATVVCSRRPTRCMSAPRFRGRQRLPAAAEPRPAAAPRLDARVAARRERQRDQRVLADGNTAEERAPRRDTEAVRAEELRKLRGELEL